MRRTYGALLAAFVLASVGVQAQERVFVIDPVHSGLGFRIRHLYSILPGRLDSFSGTVTCNTNDLTTTKVSASVDVASIYTGNADRDKHLRSADFFNVASFPKASFQSTQVTPGPDNTLTIRGKITLRDVTADITFQGKVLGYGIDHKGAKRVGYHGEGTIDRTVFGIVYNMTLPTGLTMLGSEVTLILDMEAVETDPAPAAGSRPVATQDQEQNAAASRGLPAETPAAVEKALKQ